MQTLFEKVWQEHVIKGEKGQAQLIYVDLQMIHEVTSPQAFEGLRQANRPVRCPDKTFATMDHNTPTKDIYNMALCQIGLMSFTKGMGRDRQLFAISALFVILIQLNHSSETVLISCS